jgi:hypothetical protein
VTTASAQSAPGGIRQHSIDALENTYGNARAPARHSPGPAARKAALPRGGTTEFGYQDGFKDGFREGLDAAGHDNSRRNALRATTAKHHGESASVPMSQRPRNAHGDAAPQVKHNDASLLPPHGSRGGRSDGFSAGRLNDRSTWGNAMGQGQRSQLRARPEHDPRRQPSAKVRGQQDLLWKDLTRNKAPRRQPDQGTGRSEFRGVRNQARGAASPPQSHRAAAGGQPDVRNAQEALNQQGFNAGTPDGKLGKLTRNALMAFQKQRGFRPTGKTDRATLQALLAGGGTAPGPGSPDRSAPEQSAPGQSAPAPRSPGQASPAPVDPVPAPRQGIVAPQTEPGATTGQGSSNPPQPIDGDTSPAPDTQMPDADAPGRVPAGSPREDLKDDASPKDDQR